MWYSAVPEKKKKLSDAQTKIVALNSDVMSCEAWNEEKIVARADRLAGEILKLHAVEVPSELVSFADPRYKEYSCENTDDATNKSANYVIQPGERVICDNFSNMLRLVIDRLYLHDKSVIDDMCANKRKIFTSSQGPFFSYDVTEVKYPDQVANSGIYHSNGFSAATIMWIIQALLDKHEIERSEFIYSARSTKPAAKEETE